MIDYRPGSAQPASPTGSVQFNNAGKFGGSGDLSWDNTNNKLVLKNVSSQDNAVLSATLLTSTNFSNATYWTITTPGDWTLGTSSAIHVIGNTDVLTSTAANFTPLANTFYQIVFRITGTITAGETIMPSIGGVNGTAVPIAGVQTQLIFTNNATPLAFTPTTNWNGTISQLSVKQLTQSTPILTGVSSSGSTILEYRISSNTGNVFFGLVSGPSNTSLANNNTAFGTFTLNSNTTGSSNLAFGLNALRNNTSGGTNTAVGVGALTTNISGSGNVAIGASTLSNSTYGGNNTAIGTSALSLTTIGNANLGLGSSALGSNTTGSSNVAIGNSSGSGNTTGNSNTLIGASANISSGTLTNASAFGANAQVGASNSLVLGSISGVNGASSSVNVGIGTQTPNASLQIVGGVSVNYKAIADANYTTLTTDYIIGYTSLTAARTVTLPTAVGVTGQLYVVKDEAGAITATNTLTIATTSSQTIDGSTTAVISVPYTSLTLYSNGANWLII